MSKHQIPTRSMTRIASTSIVQQQVQVAITPTRTTISMPNTPETLFWGGIGLLVLSAVAAAAADE